MSDGMVAGDSVARLERAASEYRDACDAVDEVGESRVEAVADALRSANRLLDRYEERATGTGDFQGYVEFRRKFDEFVDDLPDDLRRRKAFETAGDRVDKRRLSESDFAAARETLAPAEALAGRFDDRTDAADRYREARRDVAEARAAQAERCDALSRLLELGAADLAADVSSLRDPIESYDDAVRAAFASFKREASASEALAAVADAAAYPLVGFPEPPADLRDFLRRSDAGKRSIPTLLEYADYSRSKLSHYVDDVGGLKRAVGSNRTYLQRLDADPLTVGWPPPPADDLRWRARELVSVVAQFGDDEVLARLHAVRRLVRGGEYARLREAAVTRAELTESERKRLLAGEVEPELERARAERDRLDEALSAHPGP